VSQIKHVSEAELFKALAHPARLAIIQLLKEGEKCVCEIVPALGMEQPNVSRHLALLKKEGVLSSRKEGMRVIYWVEDPRIFQLIDASRDILQKHWDRKRETFSGSS